MGKRAKNAKNSLLPYYIKEVATNTKIILYLDKKWCYLEKNPIIGQTGTIACSVTKEQEKLYNYLKNDPTLIRGLVFKAIQNSNEKLVNFVIVSHFSEAHVSAKEITFNRMAISGISNLLVVEFQNDYPKELSYVM